MAGGPLYWQTAAGDGVRNYASKSGSSSSEEGSSTINYNNSSVDPLGRFPVGSPFSLEPVPRDPYKKTAPAWRSLNIIGNQILEYFLRMFGAMREKVEKNTSCQGPIYEGVAQSCLGVFKRSERQRWNIFEKGPCFCIRHHVMTFRETFHIDDFFIFFMYIVVG